MNKLTDEQVKEFWERCGLRFVDVEYSDSPTNNHIATGYHWKFPNGDIAYSESPPIDRNNLFKHAVPIAAEKLADIDLSSVDEACWKLLQMWLERSPRLTPLALFGAIWEVIKREDVSN